MARVEVGWQYCLLQEPWGDFCAVFVDESGNFTKAGRNTSVSIVGALVIPDERLGWIEKKYTALRSRLPREKGEVKGRLLSESDVSAVVDILRRNDALLELTAVDLGVHEQVDIEVHQRRQAEGITNMLTPQHHANMHAAMWDLRRRLESMPNQLYVQSVAMFDLLHHTLHHATVYYSQRRPKELGKFSWIFDAKGRTGPTDWEEWWKDVVMPMLQSKSIRQPMGAFVEGDYSHFERFHLDVPEWLPAPQQETDGKGIDLRKILMEDFRFSASNEPGLEMVDVLVNAARRALIGHLGPSGWAAIPRLMIHRRHHYIHMIALHDRDYPLTRFPYRRVLRAFGRYGRSLLAPRFLS